ncbi:hypothetical protein Bint_1534 [Brachyspira intermedia PWS/A]|uniref:Uncharacterized protein n=1 Tax=Brachyspira intermedia (strain ATCC 51140 / PWS/A) TaxID=1045858 RepID=G0EQQ2_BRAIP|nr:MULTISPECIES: hypothetical protein [Brachyspira]AEM22153.1 hypothetical protein Bint_1534 [Brachyspira intermedia PWS/A]
MSNKLDDDNNISSLSSKEYYKNEYNNLRILLFEYDKAILSVQNHKSYTLNTGQTTQTVTRHNLSELIEAKKDILNQMRELEMHLGIGKPSVIHVNPSW